MMKNAFFLVMYSAVVLNAESQEKLKLLLRRTFPREAKAWTIYCHHMTICLGRLPEKLEHLRDHPCALLVTDIGSTNLAIAVRVHDALALSFNRSPHVTLAVNPQGGEPKMSNDIVRWFPLPDQYPAGFMVHGVIQEVKD